MRKNGIRLLLLLAVVIGTAAVVQDLHFDNSLASTRAAAYGVDGELGALNVKLSDFRAAQAAYLAAGQDPSYWMTHASGVADEITAAFGRLRSASISPEAAMRVEAAASAFASLVDGGHSRPAGRVRRSDAGGRGRHLQRKHRARSARRQRAVRSALGAHLGDRAGYEPPRSDPSRHHRRRPWCS